MFIVRQQPQWVGWVKQTQDVCVRYETKSAWNNFNLHIVLNLRHVRKT